MLEDSEKEYDKVLALDHGYPRFRSAGLTYLGLGKYKKALQAYDFDKRSSFSLFSSADIMLKFNRIEEAISYYDTVIEQEASGIFYYTGRAMKFIIDKNYQDAFEEIQKFENENPLDPEMWYLIATRYGLISNEISCVRALEEAIDKGFYSYSYFVNDSFFDSVRNGKEFQRIMLKAKEKHKDFKHKYYHSRSENPGGI